MKIRVFRQSGTPVEPEAQKAYDADWKAAYDKVAEKAGLDMLRMQKLLARIERSLIRKHGSQIEIELPKSAKAWEKLCAQYQVPIMCAQEQNSGKLVLIVMDALG